jgi:hypothetical protein
MLETSELVTSHDYLRVSYEVYVFSTGVCVQQLHTLNTGNLQGLDKIMEQLQTLYTFLY